MPSILPLHISKKPPAPTTTKPSYTSILLMLPLASASASKDCLKSSSVKLVMPRVDSILDAIGNCGPRDVTPKKPDMMVEEGWADVRGPRGLHLEVSCATWCEVRRLM